MDFPFKLLATGAAAASRSRPTAKATTVSSASSCRFISLPELFARAASSKITYFGEFHSEERIAALLERLVASYASPSSSGNATSGYSGNSSMDMQQGQRKRQLHIVCEHFSFEMNDILQKYQLPRASASASLTFEQLVQEYKEIGTEGHQLETYRNLLEYCRQNANQITLHGGFIPRPCAAAFMRASKEDGNVEQALIRLYSEWVEKGYLPDIATLRRLDEYLGLDANRTRADQPVELYGSPNHYNYFEFLMSGRDVYDPDPDPEQSLAPPEESRRKIFQAQLIKDYAMAYRLKGLVNSHPKDDRFLVLAGRAHLAHYHGVPEIYSWLQSVDDDTVGSVSSNGTDNENEELLICAQMMYECDLDEREDKESDEVSEQKILKSDIIRGSFLREGSGACFEKPIADVLYVYDEQDWSDDEEEEEEDRAKNETIDAYNKVGETAAIPGNTRKAKAILSYLGYTEEEQQVIGDEDIANYQGVGNPFPLANIQPGQHIIDLGSGLGVDTFLAAHYAGPTGEVLGVDIARKEVKHANTRAEDRGLSSYVCFWHNDIEKLKDIESDAFDVAISNGAFCLIPNKEKAFATVYRVLKPGGRMAICTTTVRKDLDVETQWPMCMNMFIHLDKLKPMCEKLGFKNVVIDLEDSELEFELEGVCEEDFDVANDKSGREKIHVGSDEFKHLEGYDMNELCARVVVYGEK